MFLFAITGSIAAGKSKVAELLRARGIEIIEADHLAREAVRPGETAHAQIAAHFGKTVIDKNGQIDRQALAKIIFADAARRAELEKIVHPQVQKLFAARIAELKKAKDSAGKIVAYVVPLLFEANLDLAQFKKIVVVAAPPARSIMRIVQRDKCSQSLAEKKYAAQMDIEEKKRRADYVVENDGNLAELERKAGELYEWVLGQSK